MMISKVSYLTIKNSMKKIHRFFKNLNIQYKFILKAAKELKKRKKNHILKNNLIVFDFYGLLYII